MPVKKITNSKWRIAKGNIGQAPHRASRLFLSPVSFVVTYAHKLLSALNMLELWILKKARIRATAADLVTGQAMLIFVLVLGATMLGVTTIAGYVTLQKLRASTDIVDSAKSIYAADSGVEWCLNTKFGPTGSSTDPCTTSFALGNDSSVDVQDAGTEVKAIGHAGRSYRAFGIFLNVFNQ